MASPWRKTRSSGSWSLEYLVAAYGADKLNDPAKAEPVLTEMIQARADRTVQLLRAREDLRGCRRLRRGRKGAAQGEVRPSRTTRRSTCQLAGYYNRQGQFDKTIEALEQRAAIEPNNPEAFQTIAAYYWDETRGDASLTDVQKRDYITKGLEAVDKAIALKSDYVEAITFRGLLLRLQANIEKDPAKQQALLKEATELGDKANELRKQKTAGTSN